MTLSPKLQNVLDAEKTALGVTSEEEVLMQWGANSVYEFAVLYLLNEIRKNTGV